MTQTHAIKIAIAAMGGQGGGVLANWIVQLAEKNGFIAQMTSVPGVAQRTGATVYYVELFPLHEAQASGKYPVLALMPTPGDVDIVIAAELMEAGRAVKRGFVSKRTTLIASTHRDYAISEKIALGDGRHDARRVEEGVRQAAGGFVGADMAQAASEAGAVISAALFGALAGSRALPFDRNAFEETIRAAGRAVDANLRGFARGFEIAEHGAASAREDLSPPSPALPLPATGPLMDHMQSKFPPQTHYFIFEGLKRAVDFQDVKYADQYLNRLASILAIDKMHGGDRRDYQLTQQTAKHLALWMTYEDTIRVADLKTRRTRFERFRDNVRAEEGQIVEIREFMHPRVEELCDLLPPSMARAVLGSSALKRVFTFCLGDGRRMPTTKLRGFLPLYLIASLRFMRRMTFRHVTEQERIEEWLSSISEAATTDYHLAIAIARMQRLIKGYGDTHERSLAKFNALAAALPDIAALEDPGSELSRLIEAAMKDEDGDALAAAIAEFGLMDANAA